MEIYESNRKAAGIGIHPTLSTRSAAVMAVTKHHDSLAEDAVGGIGGRPMG